MSLLRTLSAACLVALATPAPAQELGRAFGHALSVTSTERFGPKVLKVDGRELLREQIITLDEVAVVGGMGVVIGQASAGGNACDGSPFVLSFPEGAAPRIDGPPEACGARATIRDGRLTLATEARIGQDGETWSWDPGRGLVPGPKVAKAVSRDSGWERLRSREINHPARFLDYADTAGQVRALAGDSLPRVEGFLSGVGSGTVEGTTFAGETCANHDCLRGGLLLLADIPNRRIYLAWTQDGPRVASAPAASEWPPELRARMRSWADRKMER